MRNNFIKAGLVLTVFLTAFVFYADAGSNSIGGQMTCDTGDAGNKINCGTLYKSFSSAQDYYQAGVNYQVHGHRHGASQIDWRICVIPNGQPTACQQAGCSGSGCGDELGGGEGHANIPLGGDSFGQGASPDTSFQVSTWMYADDAGGVMDWNGTALFLDPAPPPPSPPPGMATAACVVSDVNSGNPIPGANCSFAGQNLTTNGAGYAAFQVDLGTYNLTVTLGGCSTWSRDYTISVNTNMNVPLNCGGGGPPPTPPPPSVYADIKCNGTDGPCYINVDSTVNIRWCGASSVACTSAASCTVDNGGYAWTGTSGNRSPDNGGTYFLACTSTTGTVRRDNVSVFINNCDDGASTVFTVPPPAVVSPGQTVPITVQTTNTGGSTWWHGIAYRVYQVSNPQIAAINPADGMDYIQSTGDPGTVNTQTFDMTAPAQEGTYTIEYSMVHSGGANPPAVEGWAYRKRSAVSGTRKCKDGPASSIAFGSRATATFAVKTIPEVENVSISDTPNGIPVFAVAADAVTPYYITVTASDPGGAGQIAQQHALINYLGANAGNYRGYLSWSQADSWPLGKEHKSCTGGGFAVIQPGVYGDTYIRYMDSCTTSTSGNTRTTTFAVRFDPSYTTPISDNDIAGWVADSNSNTDPDGWENFETNFNIETTPDVDTITISDTPAGPPATTVATNSVTPYYITITGSDPGGGGKINYEYIWVNQNKAAADWRGFVTWSFGDFWPSGKDHMACAGGGFAVIQDANTGNPGYGDQYLNLDSCTTSILGNTRTTTFAVRFAPSFTAPVSDNDISGYVYNANGNQWGWESFDTNFSLMGLTVSFTASPAIFNLGQSTDLSAVVGGSTVGTTNYNIWWDCPAYNNPFGSDPTPTVAEAQAACGDPDLVNNCSNQTLGYKCDGMPPASGQGSQTVTYTYTTIGTKRPIVIAERGGLSAFGVASGGVMVNQPVPTVAVGSATNITPNGATLNGTVNPNGSSTTAGFRWGTSNVACSSLPNVTPTSVHTGSSVVAITPQNISGLSSNTTYYFCVTATNAGGTANSNVSSFTTPSIPVASSTTVTVNNSNYCSAGVHATINGTYSDAGGTNANAYQVFVNGGADTGTDPNVSPNLTTGVNPAITPEWWGFYAGQSIVNGGIFGGSTTTCNTSNTVSAFPNQTSGTTQVSLCAMNWNTVYTSWARVRNSGNIWSPWVRMSTYCNGGTYSAGNPCNGGTPVTTTTWTTPVHAYPQTGFTFSPGNPAVDQPVTFTDTTVFQGASAPRTWIWDFSYPSGPDQTLTSPPRTIAAPGTSGASTNGNTVYVYTTPGYYTPRLTTTDDIGQSCSLTSVTPIGVQGALPQWREVAPR